MAKNDYTEQVFQTLEQIVDLLKQQNEIELQLAKLTQLYHAQVNMLEDQQRQRWLDAINAFRGVGDAGLTDAIKNILITTDGWLTATNVRDKLKQTGFDFSKYESNPLASISAVLRRWKPEEVETQQLEGVNAYRWKKREVPTVTLNSLMDLKAAGKTVTIGGSKDAVIRYGELAKALAKKKD